ncbi:MAG TPA: hypothetical protein VIM73_23110 [Polyangiaceae bacterium]
MSCPDFLLFVHPARYLALHGRKDERVAALHELKTKGQTSANLFILVTSRLGPGDAEARELRRALCWNRRRRWQTSPEPPRVTAS